MNPEKLPPCIAEIPGQAERLIADFTRLVELAKELEPASGSMTVRNFMVMCARLREWNRRLAVLRAHPWKGLE